MYDVRDGGKFIVDRIDPQAEDWRTPVTSKDLVASHATGEPVYVAIEPAIVLEAGGTPAAIRLDGLCLNGLAGALHVGPNGQANLRIATVPPIAFDGALVQTWNRDGHDTALVFVTDGHMTDGMQNQVVNLGPQPEGVGQPKYAESVIGAVAAVTAQ
ncbi:MAG TPA: hypothetical protein VLH86_01925 [Patescibacteria group bacterium]|nr:hypothetical protein [Patescibacteria group bacterium]